MTTQETTQNEIAENQFLNQFGKEALDLYHQILRKGDAISALAFSFVLTERAHGILRKNTKQPTLFQLQFGIGGLSEGVAERCLLSPHNLLRSVNPKYTPQADLEKVFKREVKGLGVVHYLSYANVMLDALIPIASKAFNNLFLFSYPEELSFAERNLVFEDHYLDAVKYVNTHNTLIKSYFREESLEEVNNNPLEMLKLSDPALKILSAIVVSQNAGNYFSRETLLTQESLTRTEFKVGTEELQNLGYISRKHGGPFKNVKVNVLGPIPKRGDFPILNTDRVLGISETFNADSLEKLRKKALEISETKSKTKEEIQISDGYYTTSHFPNVVAETFSEGTKSPEGLIAYLATTTRAFEVCYSPEGYIVSIKVS